MSPHTHSAFFSTRPLSSPHLSSDAQTPMTKLRPAPPSLISLQPTTAETWMSSIKKPASHRQVPHVHRHGGQRIRLKSLLHIGRCPMRPDMAGSRAPSFVLLDEPYPLFERECLMVLAHAVLRIRIRSWSLLNATAARGTSLHPTTLVR